MNALLALLLSLGLLRPLSSFSPLLPPRGASFSPSPSARPSARPSAVTRPLPSSSLFSSRPPEDPQRPRSDDGEPPRRPPRRKENDLYPTATQNPLLGLQLPQTLTRALLAGAFVLGVAAGTALSTSVSSNPRDLASRDTIDKRSPNPELCAKYGASAMAFDYRMFVSFNPFSVFVSQADVQPGCVLRASTAPQVLASRSLLTGAEINSCKKNLDNTWAFVGDLDKDPQLNCVYQSDDRQNEFLREPGSKGEAGVRGNEKAIKEREAGRARRGRAAEGEEGGGKALGIVDKIF